MKDEYDFRGAVRGKFYRPGAKVSRPMTDEDKRLEEELARLGKKREPPPGWQARVWKGIRKEQAARRRRGAVAALARVAVEVAIVIVVIAIVVIIVVGSS